MSTLDVEVTIVPKKQRRERLQIAAPPRIPRITRLMALAIKLQDMVDRGEVRDYADLARLGYVSRARITQIMNLRNLAPDIQEQILVSGPTIAESALRSVVSQVPWPDQREAWKRLAR